MAVWVEEYGLLYALCPRTASTATLDAIRKNLGGELIPQDEILDDQGMRLVDQKHSTFNDILEYDLLDRAAFDAATRAVTVRNPFDSIYSVWYKKKHQYVPLLDDPTAFIHRIPGFADDIRYVQEHDFSEWFLKTYGPVREQGGQANVNFKWIHHANFVMKMENLAEDFARLLQQIGVKEPFDIPVLNVTEGRARDYRVAYDDKARELGEVVFRRELDRLGYSFE